MTSRDASVEQRRIGMTLVPVALAFLLLAGLLIYGAGRGLDLTDEIFYLIWARNPNAYPLTYQPFGHVLHPLFMLVRADLQTYRLAGFAIVAGAGTLLGHALAPTRRDRLIFATYGAMAALTIFFPWIITPSYNSAANSGAMLVIAGMLKARAPRGAWRVAGAPIGGAGLCLAAYGKPPLFLLSLLAMVVIATRDRHARAPVLAAALTGLTLIAIVLPPADLLRLVARIGATQHILALPNQPLALPGKIARDWFAVPGLLSLALIAALLALAPFPHRWRAGLAYAAMAVSLAYIVLLVPDAIDGSIPDFLGLALLLVAAGYAALVRPAAPLPLMLLLGAPVAVALGTFNNQWFQLNFSMAFPFLALFLLAFGDAISWRRRLAQAIALAGPLAVMLLAAFFPYSLPASIFDQQQPIAPPLSVGTIKVDPETAAFVQGARGLAPSLVLIDLSGTGPGVAVVLGAHAPTLPWLNPATPGWPDVVWRRLDAADRTRVGFVGPVWPLFAHTAPARWFAAHRADYCRRDLPPMTFWEEERRLQLWRPCRPRLSSSPAIRPGS